MWAQPLMIPELLLLCGLAALFSGWLGNTRPLKSLVLSLFSYAGIILGSYYMRQLELPPGEAGIALALLIGGLFLILIIFIPLAIFIIHLVISSSGDGVTRHLTYGYKALAFSASFVFLFAIVIYCFFGP